MQWSKLKKQVESRFAASVAGRVELRLTSYRHAHDGEGRGWITIDRIEVHNFCTHQWMMEHHRLVEGIREASGATDWTDPRQASAYYYAYDQAEAILEQRGIVSQGWFYNGLCDYLSLSIEEALASPSFLHRALAMLDGRLGKRRLRGLETETTEHPLVIRMLQLRRSAEGIRPPAAVEERPTPTLTSARRLQRHNRKVAQ